MRRTGYVYALRYLLHDPGSWHPERPDRLKAIHTALVNSDVYELLCASGWIMRRFRGWSACTIPAISGGSRRPASRAGRPWIRRIAASVRIRIMTALLAVGGVMLAVDAVLQGRVG